MNIPISIGRRTLLESIFFAMFEPHRYVGWYSTEGSKNVHIKFVIWNRNDTCQPNSNRRKSNCLGTSYVHVWNEICAFDDGHTIELRFHGIESGLEGVCIHAEMRSNHAGKLWRSSLIPMCSLFIAYQNKHLYRKRCSIISTSFLPFHFVVCVLCVCDIRWP